MASSAINIKGTTGKDALRNLIANPTFANWSAGSTIEIGIPHSSNTNTPTADDWSVRFVTDRDGTTSDALRIDKDFHPIGQTEVAGNNNFYLQMYNGAVSDGTSGEHRIALVQRLPNVRLLQANSTVLSFWARGYSAGQKIAIGFRQVFGTSGDASNYDEFGQGATASYPVNVRGQEVELSTSWRREEVRFEIPSISGKEIGTKSPDYLELSFYVQAGQTAANKFNLPAGISWGGETFELANVQLEKGVNMSEFENIQGTNSFARSVGGANIRAIASGQITHWASSIENAIAEVYHGVTQAGPNGHGGEYYVNLNAKDPSTGGTGNNCLQFGSFVRNNAGKPVVIVSPSVAGQNTSDELHDVQTVAETTTDRRVIKVTSFSDDGGSKENRLFNLYAMQLDSVSSESSNPGDPDDGGGGGCPPICDRCEEDGCETDPDNPDGPCINCEDIEAGTLG